MKSKNKGFTLIEVIVVAAIIAILAGILVPMIFNQIDEAKISRAAADCKSIQTAILTFKKDTGSWPNKSAPATADVTLLIGNAPGNFPLAALTTLGYKGDVVLAFNSFLAADETLAYSALWKGPYQIQVELDPWGNAYITNAKNFDDTPSTPVWVLSAGPNGTYETPPSSAPPVNDDIGVRIK